MSDHKLKIGLIVDYLASEYSSGLIDGVASCCKEFDMDLFIFPIGEIRTISENDVYQYVAVTAHIKKENLDGIIITSGTQLHDMTKLEFMSYLKSYKPLKMVSISLELSGIPSILVDCENAFESMIQNLIDKQGCKKFALLGVDSNSYDVKNRTEIFKKVLKRNKLLTKDVPFWKSDFEYNFSYSILDDYYKKNNSFDFDAIVALNDDMAFAAIDFCKTQLKLNVPNDIIVTGFDNSKRTSFFTPSLSTIDQNVVYQGYKAAEVLRTMLIGEKVPSRFVVPAKTILRESTAAHVVNQSETEETEYLTVDKSTKEDINNRYSVAEWFNKRTQLYDAAHFYTDMKRNIPIENIPDPLTHMLQSFGFSFAAVVMFDRPIEKVEPFEYFNLPEQARVIAGFDYSTGFQIFDWSDTREFNPREELLPKGIIKYSNAGTVVQSLFQEVNQYGYILLAFGNYDFGVYDLIVKAISNQLASSVQYSKMISEQDKMRDRYKKLDILAHTDDLTGLQNRRGFMEVGQATMNFAESVSQSGILIYCDMDGLKKINDTYGHDAGDIAIKAQGEILKKNFRINDTVARLAGDEFAVLCASLTPEAFKDIKKKINEACRVWNETSSYEFTLSISMGFVEYPSRKHGFDLAELLNEADISLYEEKRKKKKSAANKEK